MPDKYLGTSIGRQRSQAVYRILGLIYLFTLWPIVSIIGMIAGVIFAVIDILWQLATNSSGFGMMGIGGFASRLFRWPLDQLGYILIGQPATFRFVP